MRTEWEVVKWAMRKPGIEMWQVKSMESNVWRCCNISKGEWLFEQIIFLFDTEVTLRSNRHLCMAYVRNVMLYASETQEVKEDDIHRLKRMEDDKLNV